MIAAPVAAWLVRHVPPRLLGSLVGGMIVLTNARTLLRSDWIDADPATQWLFYGPIIAAWALAIWWSVRKYREDRVHESADAVSHLAAERELVTADEATGPAGTETRRDQRSGGDDLDSVGV